MLNLFDLPDELWICVLHEWIGQSFTLCAFDVASCNHSLRQRYLANWLCGGGAPVKMFPNLHFAGASSYEIGRYLGVEDLVWFEKRKIHPTSLSYLYADERKLMTNRELEVVKDVEELRTTCAMHCTVFFGNIYPRILNDFPKLKSLTMTIVYDFTLLGFHYTNAPYPLVDLTLFWTNFPTSNESLAALMTACPLLEMVDFKNRQAMSLNLIQNLLKLGKHLKSVNVDCNLLSSPMRAIVSYEEGDNIAGYISLSLRSLTLHNRSTANNAVMRNVLQILKMCPMIKELSLKYFELQSIHVDAILQEHWCDMIATCWKQLTSLELRECNYLTNNPTIMQTIGSWCGGNLRVLKLCCDEVCAMELIEIICRSFTHLEILHFTDQKRGGMCYRTMVEHFQQAQFRETLNRIESNGWNVSFPSPIDNEPSLWDYSELLNCFPALKSVSLCFGKKITTASPLITLQELESMMRDSVAVDLSSSSLMRTFVNLERLCLSKCRLSEETVSIILTLPSLQYLALKYVLFSNKRVAFHPDSYPADPTALSPLKEFTYCDYDNTCYYFPFGEEAVIRAFLQRFSSLQLFGIKHCLVEKMQQLFRQLQKEYRYRTIIIQVVD